MGRLQLLPVDGAEAPRPGRPAPVGRYESASDHGLRVEPGVLALAAGRFRPRPGIEAGLLQRAAREGRTPAVLLFREDMRPALRARLRSLGIELLAPLPGGGWQAEIPARALRGLAGLPELLWAGDLPPRFKIHPELAARLEEAGAGEELAAWVSLTGKAGEGAEAAGYARLLESRGLRLEGWRPRTRTFAVRGPAVVLEGLAAEPWVFHLGDRRPPRLANRDAVAATAQDTWRGRDDGSQNVSLGIIDSGYALHADLSPLVAPFDLTGLGALSDGTGHGTHVAGTILGTGAVDLRYQGMAPGLATDTDERVFVGRWFDDQGNPVGDVTLLYDAFAQDWDDGTGQISPAPVIVNCSWGTDPVSGAWFGTEQECIDVDQRVWDHRQTYVFAAGNAGSTGVARPAVAKNVLAVGSIQNFETVAGDDSYGDLAVSSARGPAGDGRLKPEIVAPGEGITSTDAFDPAGYITRSGTSHATAVISGILASLVDDLPFFFSGNPALTRSWLMASALKPGGDAPVDSETGFGVVNAERLHDEDTANWYGGWVPFTTVREGGTWALWTVDVPPGTRRMTVVLCWDEPPVAVPGGATPVTGHVDLYLDIGNDDLGGNTGEFSSTGEGNYQYLVLEDPPEGLHGLKFWPRDTDLDEDGVPEDLLVSASLMLELNDPRPAADLSLQSPKPWIQPGETATVTATAASPSHVALHTVLNLSPPPPGLDWTGTRRVLPDGVLHDLGPDPGPLVLGAIAGGDQRSVDFDFLGLQEGAWTLICKLNNDNGPTPIGHTEFEEITITVDGTPPAAPSGLRSTTHETGVWSNDTQAVWTWNPPADVLSGVEGYSLELGPAPALPDTTRELGRTLSWSSSLDEGDWWLSLRAVDRAGNWSSEFASSGPLRIDLTPPPLPNALASDTHLADQWSREPLLHMTWSQVADAASGVAGYSTLVDPTPDLLPDESPELGAVLEDTVTLAEGDWYYKIRSLDRAGNLNPGMRVFGPVRIDLTPPGDPSAIQSQDFPAGVWVTDPTGVVDWTPAVDALSGISGYGASFSAAPELPPETEVVQGDVSSATITVPDGAWYLNLRAVDEAGNWGTGFASYGPLQVDTVPPGRPQDLASSTHPLGTWSAEPQLELSWTPAPDNASGTDAYSWQISATPGQLPDDTAELGAVQSLQTPVSEGVWYLQLRARDQAGLWSALGSEYGPFLVDLTEPDMVTGLQSPTHSPGVWSGQALAAATWTPATDNLSGIAGYSVEWAPAPVLPDETAEIGAVSATSTTLAEGSWWFSIRSQDLAGNWDGQAASLGPFQVDLTPPDPASGLQSPTHPAGQWVSSLDFTVTWTPAVDALSGLAGYNSRVADTPLQPGPNLQLGTVSREDLTLAEGVWYYSLRSADLVDNWEDGFVSYGPIQIDTTAPERVTNLSSPTHPENTWSNQADATLTWTRAQDNLSGVAGYSWVADGSPTTPPDEVADLGDVETVTVTLPEGDQWFRIRTVDQADNWSPGMRTWGPMRIDLTPPDLALNLQSPTHTAGVWSAEAVAAVTWDPAPDNLSGVAAYSLEWALAPGLPDETAEVGAVQAAGTTLGDGQWWFNLRSRDLAGNWDGEAASFGPILVDLTPPEAASGLNSPSHAAGVWSGDANVVLDWTAATDAGSGVAGYSLGAAAAPALPPPSRNLDAVTTWTTALPTGAWYLNLRSVDQVGWWDDAFVSYGPVQVDLDPPSAPSNLASSSHQAGVWSNDPVLVMSWNPGTDAHSGLAGYSRALDPDTALTDESRELDAVTAETLTVAEGSWYYKLRSVDAVGNASPGQRFFGPVLVDLTPPDLPTGLQSTSHQAGVWSDQTTLDLSWTPSSDALSGLAGYSVELSPDQPVLPDATLELGAAATSLSTTLTEGVWYLNLRPVDQAGNAAAQAASFGPVLVDTGAPDLQSVLLLGDGGASYTLQEIVQIEMTVDDGAGSGPVEMRFSNDGGLSWSAWMPWQNPATWDLSGTGGTTETGVSHEVRAQVRDATGKASNRPTASIYWAFPVEAGAGAVSQSAGGSIPFTLYAGEAQAGRAYELLASASGTSPGFDVSAEGGGTLHVDLNWDSLTDDIVNSLPSSSVYTNFGGALAADGSAAGISWNPPPGSLSSAWIGLDLYFAFLVETATPDVYSYVSPPLPIRVTP